MDIFPSINEWFGKFWTRSTGELWWEWGRRGGSGFRLTRSDFRENPDTDPIFKIKPDLTFKIKQDPFWLKKFKGWKQSEEFWIRIRVYRSDPDMSCFNNKIWIWLKYPDLDLDLQLGSTGELCWGGEGRAGRRYMGLYSAKYRLKHKGLLNWWCGPGSYPHSGQYSNKLISILAERTEKK